MSWDEDRHEASPFDVGDMDRALANARWLAKRWGQPGSPLTIMHHTAPNTALAGSASTAPSAPKNPPTFAPGGSLPTAPTAPKKPDPEDEMNDSNERGDLPVSCNTCVFRLDGHSAPTEALSALGVPASPLTLCVAHSSILALAPSMDDTRAEAIGQACSRYTYDDRGPGAVKVRADQMGETNVDGLAGWKIATVPADDPAHTPATPSAPSGSSCTKCTYFVPSSTVANAAEEPLEDGAAFPVNPYYCAARGNMHPYRPLSLAQAPKYCGEYNVDPYAARPTFPPEGLFAHIRDDLGLGEAQSSAAAHTEPEDRDPSPAERAAGIVGFHRVASDDGKRFVDLPIFDPEHFSPEEQAKIPRDGDDAGPELFRDYANLSYRIAAAWALGETPALTGAPGLGKSQAAYFLAWIMQLPLERVSITSASQLDDLAGYTELVRSDTGSATEFTHGRIPQAWGKPCVLLIDEPNAGPPEVWHFLRPLTDAAKQLVLDVNHGERIERNAHSYLMMAMNPAWDYRNTGVTPLSDADGRRLVHITITPPEPEVEKQIILSHLEADGQKLSDDQLNVLTSIGAELRTLAAGDGGGTTGALQVTWGVAQQVKVAKLLRFFEFAEAFRLAGADNLEPAQRDLILGVVNRLSASLSGGQKSKRKRGRTSYQGQSMQVTKS